MPLGTILASPCSKNLIPGKTLVAMATGRKNLKYLLLENSKS
jgi:hypothetical protein